MMARVAVRIPDYLRPPCADLWQWEDGGDAIVWTGKAELPDAVSTAAFHSQLQPILTALLEQLEGLPPVSSLLLVLDACNDSWSSDHGLVRTASLCQAAHRSLRPNLGGPVAGISNWLSRIRELPKELRRGTDSQIAILSYVTRTMRPWMMESRDEEAAAVLECLKVPVIDRAVSWSEMAAGFRSVARARKAFDALRHMADHPVDADSLQRWRRTFVASEPTAAAPIELPARNRVQQVLRQLLADDKWSSVARAAMDAASVLSLPRRPSDPDVLPIGGVSDVTNRGDPERLLMTELAQEPLVMLARIASGQALYLRRETPPGPSPDYRPVFLECGIRTWGTPRLNIAAIGLAIAASEEQRGESSARLMSVAGDRLLEEDFSSREGVISHLERLEPDEHPGDAIAQWMSQAVEDDESLAAPIVVVTAATDADKRFRGALDKMPPGYLILRIERDSSATVLRRTPLGDETLQSISLKAGQQAEQPTGPPAGSRRLRTSDSSLALFLDLDPCPLRFSDHLDGKWFAATTTPGLFTISRDKRLLWFDREGVGAVQLIDRVPSRNVLAHEIDGHRLAVVVGSQEEEHFLIEADAVAGQVHCHHLESGGSRAADYVFDQGSLFRVGRWIELFDRATGECMARCENRVQHIGGPMLRDSLVLRWFAEQAGEIVLHEMTDPFGARSRAALAFRDPGGALALVDNRLVELAVLDGTSSANTLRTDVPVIAPRLRKPVVGYRSADQRTIVVHDSSDHLGSRNSSSTVASRSWYKIDLETRQISEQVLRSPQQLLADHDPDVYRLVQPRNLLTRIIAVAFYHNHLHLVMKGERHWGIHRNQTFGCLQLYRSKPPITTRHVLGQSVHPSTPVGPTRWKLRPVQIGVNRAVVDSRGLLHLRRGDDGTELTLVLHEPHVSGWASWGIRFGDPYFTGDDAMRCVPDEVVSWLEEYVRQCSRLN